MTQNDVLLGFAQAVLVEAQQTQVRTVIDNLIATGEADLQVAVANLLKNLPRPTGVFGPIESALESAFEVASEKYAAQLIATNGADAIYMLLDSQLKSWVASLAPKA